MKIGWIVKQKHIVNQSEIEKKGFILFVIHTHPLHDSQ